MNNPPGEMGTIADFASTGFSPACSQAKLHFVSGKGGTGKTTLAASLALALANEGKSVLLVETEQRQGIAQLFNRPALPYTEQLVARTDGGGTVYALAIDITATLLDYLSRFYSLGVAGKALKAVGAIDFVTAIAPGLRDVLITGKIKEVADRLSSDRDVLSGEARLYDTIVVDSPPTGRIGKFLDVTSAMATIAQGGPIYAQAQSVSALIHSPDTVVHFSCILEPLPVQETLEAISELQHHDIGLGMILLNRAMPAHTSDEIVHSFAKEDFDAVDITEGLEKAGIDESRSDLGGLLLQAMEYSSAVKSQRDCAHTISQQQVPVVVVPELAEGIDVGSLYDVAAMLLAQGVTRTEGGNK